MSITKILRREGGLTKSQLGTVVKYNNKKIIKSVRSPIYHDRNTKLTVKSSQIITTCGKNIRTTDNRIKETLYRQVQKRVKVVSRKINNTTKHTHVI